MKTLNKNIIQKLKELSQNPGVYLYRDKNKRIIYIGKAANLKNRVSSYFQSRNLDLKTAKLVKNIKFIESIVCGSEIEALLLESELIKRYKPKYNLDWKDDKNYCYIKIVYEDYPRVFIVRQIAETKNRYFGPFVDARAVRSALKSLRRIFPYCTCSLAKDKICLYYHLGLCLGHGEKYLTAGDYQANLEGLINFLEGKKEKIIKKFQREMKLGTEKQDFERAAVWRDRIRSLEKLRTMRLEDNLRDLNLDQALGSLREILKLDQVPDRIECYDISNIVGKFAVGSLAVFERGMPKKDYYRRFEIKNVKQINDFAMLQEVIRRRFSKVNRGKDKSFSKMPDLIIVDGGKGQLSAVSREIKEIGLSAKIIGLAKKKEIVFFLDEEGKFDKFIFPEDSEVQFLIQRIRDEAHRFAITYHRNIRSKALVESILDTIDGVGPVYKKLLTRKFGTIENIRRVSTDQIRQVVGRKLAEKIKKEL
jgi:excinuclease ABC subunit C